MTLPEALDQIKFLERELVLSRAETAKVESMFLALSDRHIALTQYAESLRRPPVSADEAARVHREFISQASREYLDRDRHTKNRPSHIQIHGAPDGTGKETGGPLGGA